MGSRPKAQTGKLPKPAITSGKMFRGVGPGGQSCGTGPRGEGSGLALEQMESVSVPGMRPP